MQKNKVIINFSSTGRFEECDYYFKLVIRRAVTAVLSEEGFLHDAEVSVTLCDSEYIRALNKKFRGKDRATDVLSFPMYDFRAGDEAMLFPGEKVAIGDIVISLERAREQAREIGHTFLEEVAFLTVHSMLHLLGYDHELSPEDDEAQCEAQRRIMSKLEI